MAPPPPLPSPEYYFYPKANVYFDSVNKTYVFLGNDGKTWQQEKQIPAVMQVLMDKNVFISKPSSPVWKDNENHKLVYSALLYAAPADTQEAKKPVIVFTPPPVKDAVVKKKEHKGLRRLFDKIFGRKKKKEANQ